jgi:uncharacterized protein (DUF58 family)
MDADIRSLQNETLLSRRPWYLLAALLLLLSAITRQPLAFLMGIFALVIGLVPELWYRFALRRLSVKQWLSQRHVFFGETNTLSISIENQKLLPLPWLEIEDEIPAQITLLSGHAQPSYKVNRATLVSAYSLWSFQRVTKRYHLRCMGRGVYSFGPALIRSGDPFGWLVREDLCTAHETLLVFPLVAPLETFGLPPRHPFGEHVTPRRLLEDPLRVAGVRDYVLGDDPRRIHWKATARAGELRSKIYEPSSQYRLLILLDINTYKESWMGLDPDLQELTISAAASIATWALEEGYAVGLLANSLMMGLAGESPSGDVDSLAPVGTTAQEAEAQRGQATSQRAQSFIHRVRVPLGSDSGQAERILTALGRLLPYFGSPMDTLIEGERFTLPIGTTVVLLSATAVLREKTIERLIDLRAHGAAVHLALTGEARDLDTDTYDLPVHWLGGRETWHALVTTINTDAEGGNGRSATGLHLG